MDHLGRQRPSGEVALREVFSQAFEVETRRAGLDMCGHRALQSSQSLEHTDRPVCLSTGPAVAVGQGPSPATANGGAAHPHHEDHAQGRTVGRPAPLAGYARDTVMATAVRLGEDAAPRRSGDVFSWRAPGG